jgi:hypothetical protein
MALRFCNFCGAVATGNQNGRVVFQHFTTCIRPRTKPVAKMQQPSEKRTGTRV